jgi:hypothetical protein
MKPRVPSLGKFVRLPRARQALTIKAFALLLLTWLAMRLLRFRTVRRLLDHLGQPVPRLVRGNRSPAREIGWTVAAAGRLLPFVTCLPRALTVEVLLARRGLAAQLYFGVVRDANADLQAHAWVGSQDEVVIGEVVDLARFSPLSPVVSDTDPTRP